MAKTATKKAEDKEQIATEVAAVEETAEVVPATKPTSDSKTQNLTMEDLLAQANYTLRVPQEGDVIQGTIIEIGRKMLLVDIGAKTEGLVIDREFNAAIDVISGLKVGDKVDVYVLESSNRQGQILLSLQKAALDKTWSDLEEKAAQQATVKVYGEEVNRGGMVVTIAGLRGFIPTSQFGRHVTGKLDSLVHKEFDAQILEADKEKARLIFSERLVSEADEIANSDKALSEVEAGQVVKGTVTGVKPFGVFVAVEVPVGETADGQPKLGVLEGMVHISEVSWEKIDNLTEMFKKGQEISTKVLSVDKDQKKLTLSLRLLADDPWEKLSEECPPGTTVTGTVTRVVPFGVFVTIQPGVDGLIHESKLAGQVYYEGQEVSVVVDSIDADQRRVSLSPTMDELPVTYK